MVRYRLWTTRVERYETHADTHVPQRRPSAVGNGLRTMCSPARSLGLYWEAPNVSYLLSLTRGPDSKAQRGEALTESHCAETRGRNARQAFPEGRGDRMRHTRHSSACNSSAFNSFNPPALHPLPQYLPSSSYASGLASPLPPHTRPRLSFSALPSPVLLPPPTRGPNAARGNACAAE